MSPAAVAVDELTRIGRDAGLDAVGVAAAQPFTGTRRHLEERKALGLHAGMSFTFGHPERSTDPQAALPGAASIVVGARSYRRRRPPSPSRGQWGRVAAYASEDHYRPLRTALGVLADHLVCHGWRALVLVDDNRLVDREAARRAGLGWYGKNTNLLLPGCGSLFLLGSVVTDAPLERGEDLVEDGCGMCSRCLPACPTGALVAPGVLDARRCLAHLVQAPGSFPIEYREALGDRLYGCDDCQDVCPPNVAVERRAPADPPSSPTDAWVDVVGLLRATDDELLRRYGRWYIPRRQPRYLRRNALVVLGNVGDGRDAAVEEVLGRYLVGDDEMLREHACWAAEQLGRRDLLAR